MDTPRAADTAPIRQDRLIMAETVGKTGMEPVARAMLPQLLLPASAEVRLAVGRMIPAQSSTGIAMAQRAMAFRLDRTDLLASVGCPMLVVVGDKDVVAPPTIAQGMAARIANCRHLVIPRSGHLSRMQVPRRVSRELVQIWRTKRMILHSELSPLFNGRTILAQNC